MAESLYDRAKQVVTGDRRESYGPLEESFQKIALIWSGILSTNITPQQVALCMLGMKLSRESNKHSVDNIVDIYGYAICYENLLIAELRSAGETPVVPDWFEGILQGKEDDGDDETDSTSAV